MMNYRAGSEEIVFGSPPPDVCKYMFAPFWAPQDLRFPCA